MELQDLADALDALNSERGDLHWKWYANDHWAGEFFIESQCVPGARVEIFDGAATVFDAEDDEIAELSLTCRADVAARMLVAALDALA